MLRKYFHKMRKSISGNGDIVGPKEDAGVIPPRILLAARGDTALGSRDDI
jgi:hypothetical protein